jgi:hypothetical protein
MKRWKFKQHRENPRSYWTWSLLAVDGTIETISGSLADYGAAIHDAVNHGFRPTEDHWIVESIYYTTHYARGKQAVIVRPDYDSGMTSQPPQPLRRRTDHTTATPPSRNLVEPEDQ